MPSPVCADPKVKPIMTPLVSRAVALCLLLAACGSGSRHDVAVDASAIELPTTSLIPSTTTTATVARLLDPCMAVVAGLRPPVAGRAAGDPVALVVGNRIVPLPLPGHEHPQVVRLDQYKTPEDYMAANPTVVEPEERLAVMHHTGFKGGASADLQSGENLYGIEVLRFASPADALRYSRVHLARVCEIAQPLGGPQPSGRRYVLQACGRHPHRQGGARRGRYRGEPEHLRLPGSHRPARVGRAVGEGGQLATRFRPLPVTS